MAWRARFDRIFRHLEPAEIWFIRAGDLVTFAALLAAVFHWTLRDRLPLIRALWYALPRPLLALLFAILAVWWSVRRRLWIALLCGVLAISFFFLWRTRDFAPAPEHVCQDADAMTLVFWNTARPMTPREIDARLGEIRRIRPDLVGVVEGSTGWKHLARTWDEGLGEMNHRILPDGIVLGSRFPMRLIGWEEVEERTRLATAQIVTPDGVVRLLLADVDGDPLASRESIIDAIVEQTDGVREPVIIVGDFNTPRDSVLFERLESAGFVHAFDEAGQGNRSTWPSRTPLMAIDHVWTRGLDTCSIRLEFSELSDHRRIVATIGR